MQTILSENLFVLLRQVTLLFSIGLYFLIRQTSVLAASVAWLRWSFAKDNSCLLVFDVDIHISLLVDGGEMNDKVKFTFASSAA